MSQTLLVIIPSSGTYPGIWSRSLCIDEGLLKGSMLPFFHKAMQGNMGIIVLNPNVNNYKVVDANGNTTSTPIPYNSTPDKHVLYCWDRIISRTTARNIVIMAYGQGGVYAKTLIQERESEILCKLPPSSNSRVFNNPASLRVNSVTVLGSLNTSKLRRLGANCNVSIPVPLALSSLNRGELLILNVPVSLGQLLISNLLR